MSAESTRGDKTTGLSLERLLLQHRAAPPDRQPLAGLVEHWRSGRGNEDFTEIDQRATITERKFVNRELDGADREKMIEIRR